MGKNKNKNERRKDGRKQGATNESEKQLPQQQSPMKSSSPSPEHPIPDITEKRQDDPMQGVNDQSDVDQLVQRQETNSNSNNNSNNNKSNTTTNNWRRRQSDVGKEVKEFKEQLKVQNIQIQSFVNQVNKQTCKIKELENALLSTTKTCSQLERLLQKELAHRNRLESENESLQQTITRLKGQLTIHEKDKFNSDELMRVLNATLMERETEVSILKLKLTRMQTNPSSTLALNNAASVNSIRQDPCHVYSATGRSNSELDRNSYIRASARSEAPSFNSSSSHIHRPERDASVWATVPEELTPSKRPQALERNHITIYGESTYNPYNATFSQIDNSSPLTRDRRYRTLPHSIRSPNHMTKQEPSVNVVSDSAYNKSKQPIHCQVTNLDDSTSTSHSSGGNKTINSSLQENKQTDQTRAKLDKNNEFYVKVEDEATDPVDPMSNNHKLDSTESSHYSTINRVDPNLKTDVVKTTALPDKGESPPNIPLKNSSTPVKISSSLKKVFDKFRRSDSTASSGSKTELNIHTDSPISSPFKRGANRSTLAGVPNDFKLNMSPMRQAPINFKTDKPFAEWDTDMLVSWLTMIGLSMYSNQCRRWVKCGAHIMNATPAEVDKGLGITNHLHRKKLRLAISELNGDCDKVTKASAKLDYLWVARWLDDIGLPQYKEAFINARVDGRVLNYLTVEDLVSLGVKSLLHHASIRCGIRVLRSIGFDLQQLKRRATSSEVESMRSMRLQFDESEESGMFSKSTELQSNTDGENDVPLWTCHRVMEWLRLIDFAEFASNLRGSGVHGGLIVYEDGFNFDTLCSLLSIPVSRTLLRRHLLTFFKGMIGKELAQKKHEYQNVSSNQQLNLLADIKTAKKTQLWFGKKHAKVGQDGMDDYLCPMYPNEARVLKSPGRKNDLISTRDHSQLSKIPESINV